MRTKRLISLLMALMILVTGGTWFALASEEVYNTPEGWLSDSLNDGTPAKWAKDTLKLLGYEDAFGLQAAIETWLDKTVWQEDSKEIYILTLPNIKKMSTKGLGKYAGEEPLRYIQKYMAAFSRQIELAPAAKAIEVHIHSGYDMVQAIEKLLADLQSMIESNFKKAQIYKAFSRIAMPTLEVEAFQKKQYADKNQIPVFKKATERKALSQGDKGALVTEAQQALIDFGYLEGNVASSTYTKEMASAAIVFQRENDLPENGNRLSLEALTLLLGREDTYNVLMEHFAQALVSERIIYNDWVTNSPDEIARLLSERFSLFLATMSQLKWTIDENGVILNYEMIELAERQGTMFDELEAGYMAADYKRSEVQSAIDKSIKAFWTPKNAGENAVAGFIYFDFESPESTLVQWTDAFVSFNTAYEHLLINMQEYAENNLQPQKMPKNGVVKKPASGKTKFAISNKGSNPVYAKIYKMSGSSDTGKGSYVGSYFIYAGKSVSASLSPGHYTVTYASGEHWYGEEDMFGKSGYYRLSDETYYFEKNYKYTLTLSSTGDEGGRDARFNNISPDDM